MRRFDRCPSSTRTSSPFDRKVDCWFRHSNQPMPRVREHLSREKSPMARKIYRVVPNQGNWNVTHNGTVLSHHYLKDTAVDAGKKVAKANQPSQLVVCKADGTFEYEHTYGNDPFPPIG